MRAYLLLFLYGCSIIGIYAQAEQRLSERHTRINELYEAENYPATIRAIDAQLKEAPGTVYKDSIHLYLYKYARAHRKVADVNASIAAGERILAMVQQRSNAMHELEALFDLSWIYYEAGLPKQCVRVDSLAMVVADRPPGLPAAQRGRARHYVAFDCSLIGDHQRSAKYALAALEVYESSDSIPPTQLSETLNAIGVAYWHLGRIREAEVYYERALDVLKDERDDASVARKASAYGNLGIMWQSAGDLTRSKMNYQRSMAICTELIDSTKDPFQRDEMIVTRSRAYVNMATVYYELGDLGRSRELLDLAWKDRSSVLEPDDPQLHGIKERMADLELSAGAYDRAGEMLRNYLSVANVRYGPRSEESVRTTYKLGEIAYMEGDTLRADSLYTRSLELGSMNGEAKDINTLIALQKRAELRLSTGRYHEAMADLQRARAMRVEMNGPKHHKVALADVLLAAAAYGHDDHEAALGYATSAVELLRERVEAFRSSSIPRAFSEPQLLPDAVYWKVMAERALGKGSAINRWNEELDLAITALDRNRAALGDDDSKLQLIGAQKRLFDLAIDLAFEAYEKDPSIASADRFLSLSEADRSILLKSRLNAFTGLRFAEVPDSIIEQEQALVNALDIDQDDRSSIAEIVKKEQAYAELLAYMERTYPRYFALRFGATGIRVQDVRKRLLTPDRKLLAYVRTKNHLYALIIGTEVLFIQRLPGADLAEKVATLNRSIVLRDRNAYANAAYDLHQLVFAPLVGSLGCKELLIIPDGALHTVNFETLLASPDPDQVRSSSLLQRYSIAYLLSATTALQFADLARDRKSGTLALAPGFSDEMKQRYRTEVADSALMDRQFLGLVRQPFAVSTARTLGTLLAANVMVGDAASEPAFRLSAHEYGILHLGTHAEMNATSPMYSRLVLSRTGSAVDAEADGYLHAYEIYELDLRAQLAVLTACETGTGKNDEAEGVRSLGYSFAYAGCPSLVMSLWGIDEQVSSTIITSFYEYLADGMPKHEALRQAKLDHLANAPDELTLPYYWAGLVLVGDPSPIADMKNGIAWWIWMLIASGALLAVVLIRRKVRSHPARPVIRAREGSSTSP